MQIASWEMNAFICFMFSMFQMDMSTCVIGHLHLAY